MPYSWGGGTTSGPSRGFGRGAGTTGFDCSSLVQYAYAKAGIRLPRVSQDQQRATTSVSRADAKPGDLVFYGTPAWHVAIYLGGGKMLAAPKTGDVVKIQDVYSSGDGPTFRRVNGSGAAQSSGNSIGAVIGGLSNLTGGGILGGLGGAKDAVTGAAGDAVTAVGDSMINAATMGAKAAVEAATPMLTKVLFVGLGVGLVGYGIVKAAGR